MNNLVDKLDRTHTLLYSWNVGFNQKVNQIWVHLFNLSVSNYFTMTGIDMICLLCSKCWRSCSHLIIFFKKEKITCMCKTIILTFQHISIQLYTMHNLIPFHLLWVRGQFCFQFGQRPYFNLLFKPVSFSQKAGT